MTDRYDAIVLGGGHNGLTCGAYLAKSGLKTLVLERRPIVGGAAVSEETVPGFTFSTFSYLLGQMHPQIIDDLELRPYFHMTSTPNIFTPIYDDDFFVGNTSDAGKTRESIARFSKQDAARYPDFVRELEEIGAYVRQMMTEIPFDPTKRDWKSIKRLATFLWTYRKAGKHFYRIADLATMSCNDYLSFWFESDVVKGYLSYPASVGNFLGPNTRGSAFALLYYVVGRWTEAVPRGHVRGGMGTVTRALAAVGQKHGVEIAVDSPVDGVLLKNDRVSGVRTKSGKEFHANIVVSSIHPKILFGRLIDSDQLPDDFLRAVNRIRTDSSTWKINIACEAPPSFKTFTPEKAGFDEVVFSHIGPDIDYLDTAYLDARKGWYSEKPFLSSVASSLMDETMAPTGKHVVHLFGGHAPYDLKNGDWDLEKDRFLKSVLSTVDEAAPGFSDGIIDAQVLTPREIEKILNIPDGHILHGEMTADQMFLKRPVPRYADYRTPIAGLYQCGSACHPGGSVTGIPGYNASRVILSESKVLKHAAFG